MAIFLIFLLSALLQVNFLSGLNSPYFIFPLHLIVGVLVVQRIGIMFGIVWFILSAPVLSLLGFQNGSMIDYTLTGLWCIFLSTKIFTSHSVYGLLGLSVSTCLFFYVIQFFSRFTEISTTIFPRIGTIITATLFVTYALFIIDTYIIRKFAFIFLIRDTNTKKHNEYGK